MRRLTSRAHASPAAWVSATALLCAGCFDSRVVHGGDAGPPVDPAVVREAREALERVADEMCRHAVDCAPRHLPERHLHAWLCHPDYADIDGPVAAIERGDAVLDTEALAACLAFLDSFEGCFEGSWPETGDPCGVLVRGTVPLGAGCGFDGRWCEDPGSCEACTALCTRAQREGEGCGPGSRCASGLACRDGVCEPIVPVAGSRALGQSCLGDYHCVVGALCVDHTCQLPPASTVLGDPCFEGRWCSEGQLCDLEMRCVAPRSEGGDCPRATWCETGLVCVERRCRSVRGLGESCDDSADCGPEAPYCVGPLYSRGTCQLDATGVGCHPSIAVWLRVWSGCPTGYACVAPDETATVGECRRPVAVGLDCTVTAECESGRCVSGVCRPISRPGEPCGAESVCPGSFVCDDGRCAPGPGARVPCDDARPCVRGFCRDGVCALPSLGEPCTESCGGDAWCRDGVCTAWRIAEPGEPCSSEGVRCEWGARCDHTLDVCVDECADAP